MRYATFQHAEGHAVTVCVDHVVAVQIGESCSGPKSLHATLIQFSSGWSIPVIEGRKQVLEAFSQSRHT